MTNYNEIASTEILKHVREGNTHSVVATASTAISTTLVPIIVMLINKMGDTDNSTLIIALSLICVVTIICAVFGTVAMNSKKGALEALAADLNDMEKLVNDHFEIHLGEVQLKKGVSVDGVCKAVPKKLVQ